MALNDETAPYTVEHHSIVVFARGATDPNAPVRRMDDPMLDTGPHQFPDFISSITIGP